MVGFVLLTVFRTGVQKYTDIHLYVTYKDNKRFTHAEQF